MFQMIKNRARKKMVAPVHRTVTADPVAAGVGIGALRTAGRRP